jgi:hypothetical protein
MCVVVAAGVLLCLQKTSTHLLEERTRSESMASTTGIWAMPGEYGNKVGGGLA